MAQKKMTQAQKTSAARTGTKSRARNPKVSEKPVPARSEAESSGIPNRLIAAGVFFLLFILFLVTALNDEGYLLKIIRDVTQGLFGVVAFYVAIPAFLYLSFIQLTGAKRPVLLRSVCTGVFVFLTGCLSHLSANPVMNGGFSLIGELYRGGAAGTTGGVICGLVTHLLQLAGGNVLSYIILILGALLCLLAACGITIPSLLRAIENRPRLERPDEEERPEPPEPAQVVVNHIANRHIAYVENRRRLEAERAVEAAAQQNMEGFFPEPRSRKTKNMIEEISSDIDTPVAIRETPAEPENVVIPLEPEIPRQESFLQPSVQASQRPEPVREEPVREEPVQPVRESPVEPAVVNLSTERIPEKMPDLSVSAPVPAPAAAPESRKVTAKEAAGAAAEVAQEISQANVQDKPVYHFPPIELLNNPTAGTADGTQEMKDNTRRLNETLASFKIEAHISNVTRGPSVTRYEVELEKGVRLNKLTTMADDIALSLGASGVRIAPVPGKISVVGIEVPNVAVTTVSLREVISSAEFSRARSKSSFAVGKDIGGNAIVGNIAKLPHMLIAGTTGSGKSVCMNSIIISLIYKAGPEDVKLIMVDPKMVELGIYNGIPHLLIPVVTDPKKAAGSLQWAVTEMMRRYRSMSDAGVRDLESYNSMIDNEELEGEHLAQVVVIIDELADLMLVAAKEVEESICRIAQMGRAAGIHLIIATQRPSADVITGLMKANIPSRIAFAVASSMESRIILDTMGAEKLVGKGDMLFAPIGSGKPIRVQGCFVSDSEVEAVATYVKEHYTTTYDESVIAEIDKKAEQTGSKQPVATASDPNPSSAELECDEMLPAAVEVILETKQASVSMLQRRLKLGYARAARIVDEMEEKGIVGPFVGSKPRQILITKEQWERMKNGESLEDSEESEESIPDEPVPEEI